MATVLALVSSLLWGSSDFVGGTLARRLRAVDVVAVSQALSLAVLLVVAAAIGAFDAPLGYVGWGVAGGVVGVGALAVFYLALAEGTMGVVAPVAATGVVIPVLVGVLGGDSPSGWQLAGIGCAVVGVVGASGPQRGGGRAGVRPVLLAVLAAAGFGLVILFLARGSATSVTMTLVTMRSTSVAVLALGCLAQRRAPAVGARDLVPLAVVGGFDLGANATYSVASTAGLISVVAVLASLYPAVTVLLARQVHGERLRPVQQVGVLAALVGVVLIGVG